ncbi:hypothetical protein L6452_06356 [Arctium lappa]|uniref:Uncharacterized protein n=1 Tax=Arctium lappa TaxID=4217 RepID=A0ACB9EIH3_ARCLA|nr:hypothetical protein L6452_06356 [Arctium lappa]
MGAGGGRRYDQKYGDRKEGMMQVMTDLDVGSVMEGVAGEDRRRWRMYNVCPTVHPTLLPFGEDSNSVVVGDQYLEMLKN